MNTKLHLKATLLLELDKFRNKSAEVLSDLLLFPASKPRSSTVVIFQQTSTLAASLALITAYFDIELMVILQYNQRVVIDTKSYVFV